MYYIKKRFKQKKGFYQMQFCMGFNQSTSSTYGPLVSPCPGNPPAPPGNPGMPPGCPPVY